MNSFFYTLGIHLMGAGMKIASFFHPKAKLWIQGRVQVFAEIQNRISPTDSVIWMHVSSLGEYEQGLPLLIALKKKFPEHKLALSFFSPSGYEVVKNNCMADLLFYIPLDTPSNANKLIELLHPDYAIFVKYDFWYHILQTLALKKIPTLFISCIFRQNQIYFKPSGKWFVSILTKVTHFFVQDENSKKLLNFIGIQQVTVSGDTRFDRVKMLIKQNNQLNWLSLFKGTSTLIVAGSTWKEDNILLKNFINSSFFINCKLVIAPHNMNSDYFRKLKGELMPKTLLFSELNHTNPTDYQVIILDTVGILTKVYSYSDISYVGGAFGKDGVHNVLEPAVFASPVVYGPIYDKFIEAVELIQFGGAKVIHNQNEFNEALVELLTDKNKRHKMGKKAQEYILSKPNTVQLIIDYFDKLQ
ncbi:3-deoxy-D-manno-octulosonic-acid transferase [Apibacter mensalis]|uniref:3-deoxy-D-manno-octulosonic acid transferase n=1 Tax=Apibacter mensalis TaxID=1586267 RepID=A0A0X3AMW9_9FLAO|nr:glycosyltransferase N-terminal domain-containing protein [Apibacter mensalis]CVK15385.1 3-deoxy-D-manno-octulosonic-acid transferase [Apibacter mensalis]